MKLNKDMHFKEYLENKNELLTEGYTKSGLWKGHSQDILDTWQKLKPNLPLAPQPIPANHHGTRYDDDGIRVTGTGKFINSVLSRLKDFLIYRNFPGVNLDVQYRQVSNKNQMTAGSQIYTDPRYVMYIYLTQPKPKKAKI